MTKRLLLVLLTAAVAGGCAIEAQTTNATGSFERTLQVAGAPEVAVATRSGTLRITAGPAGTVHVSARIEARGTDFWLQPLSGAEQVARLEADPPVRQSGNTVAIGGIDDPLLRSNVSISYDVTLPADSQLRTSSASGDQHLTGVLGPIDASSRSGELTLEAVRGPLRLGARSGDIVVAGTPTGSWTIETRSGDVAMRIPPSLGFDLDVTTRSGSIEPRRTAASGTFDRHHVSARHQGGGPRVAVSTRSGSVRVE